MVELEEVANLEGVVEGVVHLLLMLPVHLLLVVVVVVEVGVVGEAVEGVEFPDLKWVEKLNRHQEVVVVVAAVGSGLRLLVAVEEPGRLLKMSS